MFFGREFELEQLENFLKRPRKGGRPRTSNLASQTNFWHGSKTIQKK